MDARPEVVAEVEDVDLSGRTVLVTGSTDGIGREAALALGRLGAAVLVHGRDEAKGREVVERIDRTAGEGTLLLADFGRREAVEGLAEAAVARAPLDVLVNNAGGFFRRPQLTPEGFEYTQAVNYLAPFLLTAELADSLARDARVVVTASEAHHGADAVGDPRSVEGYRPWRAYQRSKLANVQFGAALARRLDGPTANSFHPGFVPASGFLRDVPRVVRAAVQAVDRLPGAIADRLATSVADGAARAVRLAADPDLAGATGRYFVGGEVREPSPAARDRERQERLWTRTADWLGLDDPVR